MKLNSIINSRFKQLSFSVAAAFMFLGFTSLSTSPLALAYSSSNLQPGSYSSVSSVTSSAGPKYLGHALTGKNPDDVSISGNTAFVVNYGSSSLQIFNISNPADITLISTTATGLHPQVVSTHDDYAYVGVSGDGNTGGNALTERLQIFNVTNTAKPVLVNGEGILSGYGPIDSITISSTNYLYATEYDFQANSSGVEIYNISDPNSLTTASGNFDIDSGPNRATITLDKNLFIESGSKMQIYNISTNPTKPTLDNLGNQNTGTYICGGLTGFRISGEYAYVACRGYNRIYVVNISNPADPVLSNGVNGFTLPAGAYPSDLAIVGNYAEVLGASSNILYQYQITSGTKLTLDGTASTGGNPVSIGQDGDTVFVANYNSNTLGAFSVE